MRDGAENVLKQKIPHWLFRIFDVEHGQVHPGDKEFEIFDFERELFADDLKKLDQVLSFDNSLALSVKQAPFLLKVFDVEIC